MTPEKRIIDYDRIEEWSPWLDEIMTSIGMPGLLETLRTSTPKFLEDARDQLVGLVGREVLIDHLNRCLEPYQVRVFHGTRVTSKELRSIKQNGLLSLKLSDRQDALVAIFSQHPEWPGKASLLDEALHRLGPGAKAGRREDNSIHVCLSRAGLLYRCNPYLTHGAEVDEHIAHALFSNDSTALDLLMRARAAKIISFNAPFPDAVRAANPHGFPPDGLPGLVDSLVQAWAFRLACPAFTVVSQRDPAALRFPAPIGPERIERIDDIDDADLSYGRMKAL